MMNTERLDANAVDRIAGKAWDALRPAFAAINDALLAASESATGELTTIYIKYSSLDTAGNPFAVVWIKKSSEVVTGLSLPADIEHPRLLSPPKGCKYSGLTKYFVVKVGDEVPSELVDWIKLAHRERTVA